MISCDRASDLFGPAWDDELSVAERESLETHFAACPACQRNYDEFARTLELVQTLPRPVASDDFADRVLRTARAREFDRSVRREGRPAIFAAFGGRLALAAAVLATVGVGALVLTRPHEVAPVATRTALAPAPARTSAPAPTTALRTGDPDGPVTALAPAARPVLASVPATRTTRTTPASRRAALPGNAVASIVPDSLFDHSQDVDFVLDPVKLRRERGRGYTPVTSSVQGQAASITF